MLPVVLRYKFVENIYFESGLSIGYILGLRRKVSEKTQRELTQIGGPIIEEVIYIEYDKIDVGIRFGGGYILTEKISINTNLFYSLHERDLTTRTLALSLGIEYKL